MTAQFEGLIRFGQPGAGISLTRAENRDTIAFCKTSPPGTGEFTVTVHSETPLDLTELPPLALGDDGTLQQSRGAPGFLVSSLQPARLEALTREIVRKLGHLPDQRYRVVFHGPSDASAVNEYFGQS